MKKIELNKQASNSQEKKTTKYELRQKAIVIKFSLSKSDCLKLIKSFLRSFCSVYLLCVMFVQFIGCHIKTIQFSLT